MCNIPDSSVVELPSFRKRQDEPRAKQSREVCINCSGQLCKTAKLKGPRTSRSSQVLGMKCISMLLDFVETRQKSPCEEASGYQRAT